MVSGRCWAICTHSRWGEQECGWMWQGGGQMGAMHLFWEMLPSLGQVLHRIAYVGRDLKDQ